MATLKKLPQIAPNANALIKTSQAGTSETSSSTADSLAAAARSSEFAATRSALRTHSSHPKLRTA